MKQTLEHAADVSANEVYPPMIEVYPRIPNSTCVEFKQKVIDHNAHNRVLHIEAFKAGAEWTFKQFSDILDKWEAHAIEGMKVGASAYHQGKISLICDLRDWIKEQTKK